MSKVGMLYKNSIVLVLVLSIIGFAAAFPLSHFDFKKCKGGDGKFLKDGSLCRSFYECKRWVAKEKKCPGDQHFHPAKERCVQPDAFPCFEKPPKSNICPLANGKFLKPGTNCRVFYDCCNGRPTEKRCPVDLLFDSDRGLCEHPELYQCIDVKEPVMKCLRPNGKFLKKDSKCKAYYDCLNYRPTERTCPEDQIFDKKRGLCDWEELVSCDDGGTTKFKTSTPYSTTRVDSSEEDSDESTEKVKFSTSSRKPQSTTIKPSTSVDSSEEDSDESSEEVTFTTFSKNPQSTSLQPSSLPISEGTKQSTSNTEEPTKFSKSTVGEISSDDQSTADFESTFSPTWPTDKSTDISLSTAKEETTDEVWEETSTSLFSTSSASSIRTSISPEAISDTTVDRSTADFESTFSPTWPTEISRSTDTHLSTANEDSTDYDISTGSHRFTSESSQKTDTMIQKRSTLLEVTDSVTADIFCPEPDGYFPHPTDRHKFIGCVGGVPSIMDCPSNLAYDHEKHICDYYQ